MKIAVDEVRRLLSQAFGAFQSAGDADFTASIVVETALRKDDRVNPIAEAVADLEKFEARGRPHLSVLTDSPAVIVADLNGAPGACYMSVILGEVQRRASELGVGVYGFRNTGGVHGLSPWVLPLARAGVFGIFAWNGGSYTTVPFGSTEPFFGTNPLAYAIPMENGEPVVADFATSQIPFMNLRRAHQSGIELPPDAGMDPEGQPTTSAAVVYGSSTDGFARLRPMGGGPKGSALMLLVEVLTGALVGAKMGRAATDDPFIPEEFGGLLIGLSLERFGVADTFRQEAQRLADDIRNSKPARGVNRVQLPGDGERERQMKRLEDGSLELDDALLDRLRKLASRRS